MCTMVKKRLCSTLFTNLVHWYKNKKKTTKKPKKNRTFIPYGRVTVRCNPDTSKIVWMNLVINKLSPSILVNIYSTCLSMVNFTVDNCWICTSFHLKASYSVVVNVTGIKVALTSEWISIYVQRRLKKIL